MHAVHVLPRLWWVKRALGPTARYSRGACRRAFTQLLMRQWHTVAAPVGRTWEWVAFVGADSPLIPLVTPFEDIAPGQPRECWFPLGLVEEAVRGTIRARAGATVLARTGLAIAACEGDRALLKPADMRAARYINIARIGPPRGRYGARSLIAAFLMVGNPARRRVHITDERRVDAGVAMEEWGIDAPEMLSERHRVAIYSRWHLPCTPVIATPMPAPVPAPPTGPVSVPPRSRIRTGTNSVWEEF